MICHPSSRSKKHRSVLDLDLFFLAHVLRIRKHGNSVLNPYLGKNCLIGFLPMNF